MARKQTTVVIEAAGRDQGKHFVLKEMSAVQAEKWAMRALLALGRSGVELPDNAADAGMAAIAVAGIRAITSLDFHDAEPLLDEMMACVEVMPDPSKPMVTRKLIDDDVEEVATLAFLRSEVIELHTGFSVAASLATIGAAAKARLSSTQGPPTSPPPSPEPSPPVT